MVRLRTVVVISAILLLVTIPANYIYFLHVSDSPSDRSPLVRTSNRLFGASSADGARDTTKARMNELNELVKVQAQKIQELEVQVEEKKLLRAAHGASSGRTSAVIDNAAAKTKKKEKSKDLKEKGKDPSKAAQMDVRSPLEPSALARLEELHEDFTNRIVEHQNPDDCSRAKYLVCSTTKAACGFGCFIHRTAWCFSRALEQNRVLVLDPPIITRYGRQCDPEYYDTHRGARYTCYFQPVSKCQAYYDSHQSEVEKQHMTFSGQWNKKHIEYLPEYLEDLRELNPRYYNAWYLGHIVVYLMRPSEKLEELYQASEFNRHFDFGVHIRRTDKLKAEALRYSLNEYMMHVDLFTNPNRIYHGHYDLKYGKSVYVATDDISVQKEMNRFPQYEMNMNSGVAKQAGAATASYSNGLEGVLLDLNALVKADYFVGTMSSQLSRMVLEIKYGHGVHDFHTRVASLDEDYYCAK